jgi:hypothetical protein
MRKRIWLDEHASLEGLPLYILIMVIIAAVSLAAILGFMIYATPGIGDIKVDSILINGVNESKVVCDKIEPDGTAVYQGGMTPPVAGYDEYLKITVYQAGKGRTPLPGVDLVATSDCGVTDANKTDKDGFATISLKNCELAPGQDIGTITIKAKYPGLIGTQEKSTTVQVIRRA